MNERLPGLVVELEARIDRFEKGLAKANLTQRKTARTMERRAAQSADRIGVTYGRMTSAVAAKFARMAVPLAAGIASAGTARAIADTTRQVASLGDEAKRAGVPLQAFQEWKFVAEQNRIGVDQMTDGLKELNLRADEFVVTGQGPAAEAFARLGFGAEELTGKLKQPSELLLEIFERARRLDSAARIRVADEIFGGTAGERFVELMGRSDAELRKTIQRAHDLGIVLGDDVVQKADEVARKLDALTSKVSSFGKRVAVAIADGIAEAADFRAQLDSIFPNEKMGRAVLGDGIYDELNKSRDVLEVHKREVRDLQNVYDDLFRHINAATGPDGIRIFEIDDQEAKYALAGIFDDIGKIISAFRKGEISADDFGQRMADLVGEAEDVGRELASIDETRFGGVIGAINGISGALQLAIQKATQLKTELPGAYVSSGRGDGAAEVERRRFEGNAPRSPLAPSTSLRPRTAPAMTHELGDTGGGSKGGGGGRADEYVREVEAIRDETTALRLEAVALVATATAGKSYASAIEAARREAELLHAAQKQGREITPALRAEIAKLAGEYGEAAQAADEAEESLDRLVQAKAEVRNVAGDAFTDLITGARELDQVLADVLGRLAEVAANRAFENIWTGFTNRNSASQNSGGGTNWITTLAGALFGFSNGGFTGKGGKLEPAGVVHRGEYVISADATRRIGVQNLEALHEAARRGYSAGGYVGGREPLHALSGASMESPRHAAPVVNISAPVTVNATGGSPDQNADLARQMSRSVEASMRGVVVDELVRQMRPGNMLSRVRR
ncbi:hypothetical protein [Oceanicola sp. 22II-s10i]|uniref:hypothetical protein n=1 Tax=Oceanicola sp. 22II-s10i TaxID=1317116 RepID=UPI001130B0A0|nr:hypothetical protein [Oceanicola sp. 22II-s10i]